MTPAVGTIRLLAPASIFLLSFVLHPGAFLLSDALVTATWASIGLGVVNSVGLALLMRAWQKRDNADSATANTVKGLEDRLHQASTKLIDERFRAISHEVNNHAQGLVTSIDAINQRLSDGEVNFDGLTNADHRLELKLGVQTHEITRFIAEHCATKDDLKDHDKEDIKRFDKIIEGQHQVSREVAVLVERVSKTPNTHGHGR